MHRFLKTPRLGKLGRLNTSLARNFSSPRVLTAVCAYDGHDASILAVNRALRDRGGNMEVIYQGYNRKVSDIVKASIEEDVDVVALASYNGGHNSFFPAIVKGLRESGSRAQLVGGGGSTIVPEDVDLIEGEGAAKIFGSDYSLQQVSEIVHDIAKKARADAAQDATKNLSQLVSDAKSGNKIAIAKMLTMVEDMDFVNKSGKDYAAQKAALDSLSEGRQDGKVIFITGVGGAGKSTVTDELTRRFIGSDANMKVAVVSIDPTMNDDSALLGDRIRMNNIYHPNVFMRSMATRIPFGNLPASLNDAMAVLRASGFDLIVVESPGIGQAGIDYELYKPDLTLHVKTKEFGTTNIQLQKDQLLRSSDITVLNKIDREGSEAIYKQIHSLLQGFGGKERLIFPTQAKLPGDPGISALFDHISARLGYCDAAEVPVPDSLSSGAVFASARKTSIVPHSRRNYLARVCEAVNDYDEWANSQIEAMCEQGKPGLDAKASEILDGWQEKWEGMVAKTGTDPVYTSFNGMKVPKLSFPKPTHKLEALRFLLQEGLPGDFPYYNGVFPMRKESGAETTRQFAGLRLAEHTNERFKLLSEGVDNPRLSTAFDGITLYGDDSGDDMGSLGKIGEGGVAIDSLDDMKLLYSGFNFADISTSLTINGPAMQILALFFNTAIDSVVDNHKLAHPDCVFADKYDPTKVLSPTELHSLTDDDVHPNYGIKVSLLNELKKQTYAGLRGTLQADILKEIQAQNECIYQMDFSIRLMSDVQQFFVDNNVKKFYSVSISGYHIGEAGATPIQEMAFTIANGFTYLENYMARGMSVDDVARNFSFFFRDSNEIEWLALGPVLRKIWAIALRDVYKGSPRSQLFKYHTQTSGRALQVQDWDTLNPIRQTHHALIALLGGTNSLHVDSADEPLTTPSERFVRQATMIPNYLTLEAEMLKQQNLLSGSYAFRDLCEQVQAAVLEELMRLDEQGGVPSAMELGYQRSCISEASTNYEVDIYFGKRPIIGRNTCQADQSNVYKVELQRPTSDDFKKQLSRTQGFKDRNSEVSDLYLEELKHTINTGGNVFEALLTSMRYCTLGQTSKMLSTEGGKFSQTV